MEDTERDRGREKIVPSIPERTSTSSTSYRPQQKKRPKETSELEMDPRVAYLWGNNEIDPQPPSPL